MYIVHIHAQVNPRTNQRSEWVSIAVSAMYARRLFTRGLISWDSYTQCYAAVSDDWAGNWIPANTILQIPGSFVVR